MNQESLSSENGKSYRVLNDAVIRYALCRSESEEILKGFLNSVFADDPNHNKFKIEKLSIRNPFDPQTFSPDQLQTLDILAEDRYQEKFRVEFRVWDRDFSADRCVREWMQVYGSQYDERKPFGNIMPVIFVVIAGIQVPYKSKDSTPSTLPKIHHFVSLFSEDSPAIQLTDHCQIHIIQMPEEIHSDTLCEVSPQLANWLVFFGYPNKTSEEFLESVAQNDPNLQSALNAYREFHQDPALRSIAESCEDR